MKPDWKDAPEWARWLAMDKDGTWCWYSGRPIKNFRRGEWEAVGGRAEFSGTTDNWDETLEQRPGSE